MKYITAYNQDWPERFAQIAMHVKAFLPDSCTIHHALLEQIRQQNYPNAKVIDITQQADVGRSTFYNHYQSKAQVLVKIQGVWDI